MGTDDQRIDEAQQTVHRALERALQAGGFRTARSLANALRERGYAVSERTVAGWRSRESGIPAWALVSFGEISGLGVDALLAGEDAPALVESVARHERIIGELQAIVIEVCERIGVPWHPGQDQQREVKRAAS